MLEIITSSSLPKKFFFSGIIDLFHEIETAVLIKLKGQVSGRRVLIKEAEIYNKKNPSEVTIFDEKTYRTPNKNK